MEYRHPCFLSTTLLPPVVALVLVIPPVAAQMLALPPAVTLVVVPRAKYIGLTCLQGKHMTSVALLRAVLLYAKELISIAAFQISKGQVLSSQVLNLVRT
jgi:hypothetical protein